MTRCWWRSAACRTANCWMPAKPVLKLTSVASSTSTNSCAPTCRTSSLSATSSGQPMLAHKRRARRPRCRRSYRRHEALLRSESDPIHRLHRAGSGMGGSDRERSERERHQLRNLHLPVGGFRPCDRFRLCRRHDQTDLRQKKLTASSVARLSAPTAANCWVKSVWLSRWAATRKTSR